MYALFIVGTRAINSLDLLFNSSFLVFHSHDTPSFNLVIIHLLTPLDGDTQSLQYATTFSSKSYLIDELNMKTGLFSIAAIALLQLAVAQPSGKTLPLFDSIVY